MKEKLGKLSGLYYGFGVFGLFVSISLVVNFLRIEPTPPVFVIFVIVSCAVAILAISIFMISAGKCIQDREKYKRVIIATYIMALMIFPLSLVPAVYALRILRDSAVKKLFS